MGHDDAGQCYTTMLRRGIRVGRHDDAFLAGMTSFGRGMTTPGHLTTPAKAGMTTSGRRCMTTPRRAHDDVGWRGT
jgi:hypothetical protein